MLCQDSRTSPPGAVNSVVKSATNVPPGKTTTTNVSATSHSNSQSPSSQQTDNAGHKSTTLIDDMSDAQEAEKVVYELDLDNLIDTLVSNFNTPGVRVAIRELDCIALCCLVKPLFEQEPMLLHLNSLIKVCGDIHGQYYDLLRIFKRSGFPPSTSYLFLGDYVDRGPQSVEVICLLFAYKIKYPTQIHMIRGNHESELINRVYGFREELTERFSRPKIHKHFVNVFNIMPVAAVIEESIFCCHGGLSPELLAPNGKSLEAMINEIERPATIPKVGLLCDLLWSDPADYTENGEAPHGWQPSPRKVAHTFGIDVIHSFLERHGLDLIVRAHQMVMDGYEFYLDNRLITIFSAPGYCNLFENSAGIFVVHKPDPKSGIVEGGFETVPPQKKYRFKFYFRKPIVGQVFEIGYMFACDISSESKLGPFSNNCFLRVECIRDR